MLACMNPAKCWLRGGLDDCTWVSQKPKLTGLKSLDSEAKDITVPFNSFVHIGHQLMAGHNDCTLQYVCSYEAQ